MKKMEATADDLKFRAESDARTMKEMAMIKKDPKRLKAAMTSMHEEMSAMKDVMGMEEMEGKAKKRFSETYKEEKKEA